MTESGSLSRNLCLPSPFSEMNSTSCSFSCSVRCYSPSASTGCCRTGLSGYVLKSGGTIQNIESIFPQMDQRPYPGPPLLFHLRINFLMAVLWLSDFLMFTLAIESILTTGVGGIVLFASEVSGFLSSILVILLVALKPVRHPSCKFDELGGKIFHLRH